MNGYLNAVYIKGIEQIEITKDNYKPLDTKLKECGIKESINYRYVETKINFDSNTLEEAIKNDNYIKNECWINSIYEFYHDTLLSNNKRKHITRETILNDIGYDEIKIKEGIKVKDIIPFFEKNISYN